MRIAYLIPEFPGQTHGFFWRERTALDRMGVETHLVSTRRPSKTLISHDWSNRAVSETFYLSDFKLLDFLTVGAEVMRLGPRAWLRATRAALDSCPPRDWMFNLALMLLAVRLLHFMRAKELTHVHSHSCANAALIAMFANRFAGVSYSLTLHGDLKDYGRQQNVKWRHAAFGIAITRRLYDQIRQRLAVDVPRRIAVAPMGIDPTVFKRTGAYQPWVGEGPLRLFSCGRLNRVKGHQDLIHAVYILRQSGMDVHLQIAGEDDLGGRGFHRDLDTLVANLRLGDTVKLLGAVSERRVLQALQEAHLFVLASHHEPLGVAIMEALSCETPVIATNLGGVPELISHGMDGYLIPPRDPKIIAAAIRNLAHDPALAEQLSASGRAKVERHFNAELSASELKRLLEQTKVI